jgi:hypothetical protein
MKNPYTEGTKKQRLLSLLRKTRAWTHMSDLLRAGGYRYGARLHDMQKDGFTVDVKRDGKKPSLFWYRLGKTTA